METGSSIPSLTTSKNSQHSSSHKCISTFKGHFSSVFSLIISNKFLYSGSSNNEIRLHIRDPFHHSSSESKIVAISKSGAVKSLVVSGDKLFSAHQDHKIRVWKINKNTHQEDHQIYKLLATLPTLTDRLLNFFPAKNYVQVRRHKKVTWVHHIDAISSLCLSPDESLLYSVSWDRTLKIWRTSDFKCLESVNAHDDAINALALCKNGYVYTGSADKKIKIWRKNINGDQMKNIKHSVMAVLDKHKSAVNALALSIDGLILYSGGSDCDILVWEKNYNNGGGNGENYMDLVGGLKGHKMAILCLGVISDLICSGSADKTVRIWRRNFNGGNQRSYSCLAVMEGHTGPVKCLTACFDHNNSKISTSAKSYLIYTGSLDCDIKVWQVLVSSI